MRKMFSWWSLLLLAAYLLLNAAMYVRVSKGFGLALFLFLALPGFGRERPSNPTLAAIAWVLFIAAGIGSGLLAGWELPAYLFGMAILLAVSVKSLIQIWK